MSRPEVVYTSVERIGRVRLSADETPGEVEFACEVLLIEDCLVDESSQAVFLDRTSPSALLTWLHPSGQEVDETMRPVAFVERGVLAPLGHAGDEFRTLFETCAALFVAQRAGLLAGARIVGRRAADHAPVVDEALALYGCAAADSLGRPTYVQVGTLIVPRFWVRPADSGQEYFAARRSAAAGYSREFLGDLRSRLLPVPRLEPDLVAVEPVRMRQDSGMRVSHVCADRDAVVLPDLSEICLAERAAAYSRLQGLVAVDGVSPVDLVFLSDGAWLEAIVSDEAATDRLATLADLRGIDLEAPVVETGVVCSAADVGAALDRHPSGRFEPPAVCVLTGVWDDAEVLDDWLEHLRALGVAGVLVMDYGSTDGSRDVLTASRWSSFVELVDFPGFALDHDSIRVAAARSLWPDGWALFMDPDEFLVTASGRIDDATIVGAMGASSAIELARYRVTTVRSAAAGLEPYGPSAGDLGLRWATGELGNVAVALGSSASPTGGGARMSPGSIAVQVGGSDACLLHAPTTTFARFQQAVAHAAFLSSAGIHRDLEWTRRWRGWIEIRDEGGLREAYLRQFIADDEVEHLVGEGAVVLDDRLAALVESARDRRSLPL